MQVTKKMLEAIPVGGSATFKVDHPRLLQSVRVQAGRVHLNYPERGVRYSTSINRPTMEITVFVNPVEKPKEEEE